jgi:tRNA G18 (ribose-2'-O)-methylase SpoU
VIATTVDESKPHTGAHELKRVIKQENIEKVLLILGSEGQGVSPHLVSASDYCVSI